jgi:hypothetical protein
VDLCLGQADIRRGTGAGRIAFLPASKVGGTANWSCNPNDQRMLQVGRDGVTAGADPATALEFLYEAIGLNGPETPSQPRQFGSASALQIDH